MTTTRVTHASPAGCYAHSAERYWESDADFLDPYRHGPENLKYNCKDIAKQLVEENYDIRVITCTVGLWSMLNSPKKDTY